MRIDLKEVLLSTLIGVLIGSSVTYAETLWHQKIRCTVVVPRTIEIDIAPDALDFGECADSASKEFTVTNLNDYAVNLMWTDAKSPCQLVNMTQRMFHGGQEFIRDESVIHMEPEQSVTLEYVVYNEGERAPSGSDVQYSWTLKLYLVG